MTDTKYDRFTVADFMDKKNKGMKISMLTAYDYTTARILDENGVDSILAGDSLGMVVLGYDDTTKVTMEDMIHHIKPVVRGTRRALVVGDMPFLSYHTGISDSVRNAGRLVAEGGCKAVKLEGGREMTEEIKAIIRGGIPVMGHLGFTPQSVNLTGRPKAKGKDLASARKLTEDALLLQEAGVFAIVLECVPYKLSEFITGKLDIPTIGIGSGWSTDGQVLVTPELTGLYRDMAPKHVKRYGAVGEMMDKAVKDYISEVNNKEFPTASNSFTIDDSVISELSKIFAG